MDPEIFYRKLYDQPLVARWNNREFTSFHPHGDPPEWSPPATNGVTDPAQYTLDVHHGTGKALPCALRQYIQ